MALTSPLPLTRYIEVDHELGKNFDLVIKTARDEMPVDTRIYGINIHDVLIAEFHTCGICYIFPLVNSFKALEEAIYISIVPVFHRMVGNLVIHANALYQKDKCILLTGKSGVGKSTFSYYLSQKGWCLYSDDMISLNKNRHIVSCSSSLKLDENTCSIFNLPFHTTTKKMSVYQSSSIELPSDHSISCVVLTPTDVHNGDSDSVALRKAGSMERVLAIMSNLYNATEDAFFESKNISSYIGQLHNLDIPTYILEYEKKVDSMGKMHQCLLHELGIDV